MKLPEDDPNRPLALRMVDETIAKYEHLLPPEALADLRERMEAFALTHPEMRKMVDRARQRAVPGSSGEKDKEGEPGVEEPRMASGGKAR
jgi:hypothetical protein